MMCVVVVAGNDVIIISPVSSRMNNKDVDKSKPRGVRVPTIGGIFFFLVRTTLESGVYILSTTSSIYLVLYSLLSETTAIE